MMTYQITYLLCGACYATLAVIDFCSKDMVGGVLWTIGATINLTVWAVLR